MYESGEYGIARRAMRNHQRIETISLLRQSIGASLEKLSGKKPNERNNNRLKARNDKNEARKRKIMKTAQQSKL